MKLHSEELCSIWLAGIFMNCFSAENGKYIAVGNETGSKGSKSSFKYHFTANRGDQVFEQLWARTASCYGLNNRITSTLANKWNSWYQTSIIFSSYFIWLQYRTYAACSIGYSLWEKCRRRLRPCFQVGESQFIVCFEISMVFHLWEINVSTLVHIQFMVSFIYVFTVTCRSDATVMQGLGFL